jgi:hypothetical protein
VGVGRVSYGFAECFKYYGFRWKMAHVWSLIDFANGTKNGNKRREKRKRPDPTSL